MTNEKEEGINDALLTFIDFLYAVVFGLIVSDMFSKVLAQPNMPVLDKTRRIFILIAAFYFLAWDWLHARLLTLKNPYTRYTRFFLEILIAACSYGVALAALDRNIYLLTPLAAILFLGAAWATVAKTEYPTSADRKELNVIVIGQSMTALLAISYFFFYRRKYGVLMENGSNLIIVIGGWVFVFFYELLIERGEKGVSTGPGVPFLPRRWIREWGKIIRALVAKKNRKAEK